MIYLLSFVRFCEIITLRLLMVDIGLLGFVTCDLCLVSLLLWVGLLGFVLLHWDWFACRSVCGFGLAVA